jgi:predicted ATPase
MTHLTNIGFENFKVFKTKELFEFSPITILTGPNGSGKSSLVNGLKLLSESFDFGNPFDYASVSLNDLFAKTIRISGNTERYGNLKQYLTHSGSEEGFSFFRNFVAQELNDEFEIEYFVSIQNTPFKEGKLTSAKITSKITGTDIVSIDIKKHEQLIWINQSYLYNLFKNYIHFAAAYKESYLRVSNEYNNSRSTYQSELRRHNNEFNDKLYLEQEYEGQTPFLFSSLANSFYFDKDVRNFLDHSSEDYYFFDFESVFKKDNGEFEFQKLLFDYYGTYDKHVRSKIEVDIISYLSTLVWVESTFKEIEGSISIASNKNPKSVKFSFNDYIFQLSRNKIFTTKKNDDIHSHFFENLIEPLIKLINEYSQYDLKTSLESLFLKETRAKGIQPVILEKLYQNKCINRLFNEVKRATNIFQLVDFVEANRIEPKRIYYFSDNSKFVKQMKSIVEYVEDIQQHEIINYVRSSLQKLGIANDIKISIQEDIEGFKIFLTNRDGRDVILPEHGYGVLQLMPILLGTIPIRDDNYVTGNEYLPQILVLEEPEANLHPKLQSDLVDILVKAVTEFNYQLIIETHSEYIIRKLQYLTAKGELKPTDTAIYYFSRTPEHSDDTVEVKRINIKNNGALSDNFGPGFLDVTDNIAMEIFFLTKGQDN